jgi:hypothetical protein
MVSLKAGWGAYGRLGAVSLYRNGYLTGMIAGVLAWKLFSLEIGITPPRFGQKAAKREMAANGCSPRSATF